ncbi:MAG: prenyltransferase/squalene oxidase repeat-containing protein [Candidatus Bathyarchaeia archaeon]
MLIGMKIVTLLLVLTISFMAPVASVFFVKFHPIDEVEYIKNFIAPDGGMYESPQAEVYKEWTDATALSTLCFIHADPIKYGKEIRNALDWLVSMQRSDVPLFYDYVDSGTKAMDVDDAVLYRSAWASIALLEGYRLYRDQRYYDVAVRLQNWEQDVDGGWRSRYNYEYGLKTLRENALMLLYLTWMGNRDKAKITVQWILSMENPEGGFNAGEDVNMVHKLRWSDQNALAVWALKKADEKFDFDLSAVLDRWVNNYVPDVLDTSIYGTSLLWCFKPEPNMDGRRCLNWIKRWLNEDHSYGIGLLNGKEERRTNSETHSLTTLADMCAYVGRF